MSTTSAPAAVSRLASRSILLRRTTSPISPRARRTRRSLAAPGYSSILHGKVERSGACFAEPGGDQRRNAGICSSAATRTGGNAIRTVDQRRAPSVALCIGRGARLGGVEVDGDPSRWTTGAEHENRPQQPVGSCRSSCDSCSPMGRERCLLRGPSPRPHGLSLRVDWVARASRYANQRSALHETGEPEPPSSARTSRCSPKHFFPCRRGQFVDRRDRAAHDESLDAHTLILPHMSSFFFRKRKWNESSPRVTAGMPDAPTPVLDEPRHGREHRLGQHLRHARRIPQRRGETRARAIALLLFVPESGRFNFVFVSLTAVTA